MGKTSASELLHGLLMQEKVGYKFTKDSLKAKVSDTGLEEISEGAITGFIHRAVRFGHVQFAGKVKGNEGRMLYQYEILNHAHWDFKPKSHGSNKGRKIKNRQYNPVPDTEPEEKTGTSYPVQTLMSDQLLLLAVEVAALEKKSLKDYSTEELIAELKKRIIG